MRMKMKRIIAMACMIVFALSSPVLATPKWLDEWIEPTTNQTGDATVITGSGFLYGVMVSTDGTNDVTFNAVYDDSATTSTNRRLFAKDVVFSASKETVTIDFRIPIPYNNGVTIDLTTAGTVNYMLYKRDR
jgi:hypothetical protein